MEVEGMMRCRLGGVEMGSAWVKQGETAQLDPASGCDLRKYSGTVSLSLPISHRLSASLCLSLSPFLSYKSPSFSLSLSHPLAPHVSLKPQGATGP